MDSNYSLEFSDDEEYVPGSDMDIDIDPELTNGIPYKAKEPSKKTKKALAKTLSSTPSASDSSFLPENLHVPLNWSSEEEGDDDLNDGYSLMDNIRAASGFKVKKKPVLSAGFRRRAMNNKNIENNPELKDNLSKANEAFVRGDLSVAWVHYSNVIEIDNKNFNAYKTLGEICKIRGNINKCCFFWLIAAECGGDEEFWGLVADMSADLGHVDQAIHCYTQAISKSNSISMHYLTERSLLYKEKKHYTRALEGFQRLHTAFPADSIVVRNLASVYVEQKRYNDAVNLYMRVLDSNLQPTTRHYPKFDWTELNITCELLWLQDLHASGIKLIKVVSRWKQDRLDESWWDDQEDAEFLRNDRLAYLQAKKPALCDALMSRDFSLPIDIRMKLGMFRLALDQKDEAVMQFNFLFEEDEKSEMGDLFQEAGSNLEGRGYYAEAVPYLRFLYDYDESVELDVLLGKCLLEIEQYRDAKNVLMRALRNDPDNVDVKLILIEALYHTEEMDFATQLMEDVSKSQQPRLASRDLQLADSDSDSETEQDNALIRNAHYYKKIRKHDLDDEERHKIEENATRLVRGKFNRMQRLQPAIDQGHEAAVTAWLKLALQLIEIFMEVRSFFPKNKKTVFKGIAIYKRKRSLALNEKLHRIRHLFEGYADQENAKYVMTSKTDFRGLDYDTWFWIFMQYSFLLRSSRDDLKGATETVDLAMNVSVFKQDPTRSMLSRLVRLSLGVLEEDYAGAVTNNIRYFLNAGQFSPVMYDFFMCCFGSGLGAWAAYSNYNHQKFFLRHVKAYDSMLFSTPISGAAGLNVDVETFKANRENAHLLYIYSCLLGSNRTFTSPIVYLTRAYRQYYKDPTLCFVLGLAHVHRSMQRNSNNRHIQLLQGISYLMEYKELRAVGATVYEQQEIEYNFGRLFHMIGLPTLATRHYEKVLALHDQIEDPNYDMLMETAYNLSLIYVLSGNTQHARALTEQYLTI